MPCEAGISGGKWVIALGSTINLRSHPARPGTSGAFFP